MHSLRLLKTVCKFLFDNRSSWELYVVQGEELEELLHIVLSCKPRIEMR